MARGHPDWGIDVNSVSFFSVDNAELAARLGSIDTVTRGGKVLFMEDFNTPAFNWTWGGANANCYAWLSVYRSFWKDQHLRLTTGTGGADFIYAYRFLPYSTSIYSSVSFYLTVYDYPDPIEFGITTQTGDRKYIFKIRLLPNPYEVQYYSEADTWVTIQNLYSLESGFNAYWHYIRLLYDNVNGEYISILINDTEMDISGIKPYSEVGTDEQFQSFIMYIYGDGVQNGVVGIDALLLKIEDYVMYQ